MEKSSKPKPILNKRGAKDENTGSGNRDRSNGAAKGLGDENSRTDPAPWCSRPQIP